MTKQQVWNALQRGLGSGFLAVRENPERYRDLVVRACGRNLSFDTQCEGTRAWYVYQLVCCYPDREAFRDMAVRRLREKKPDGSWDYAHYSELLTLFAADGDALAEAALWEKYEQLLAQLRTFRRSCMAMSRARDSFETICVALSGNEAHYARIAADIGGLFLIGRQYDAWDFLWLYHSRPRGVNAALRRSAASYDPLRAYFASFDALEQERKRRRAEAIVREEPEGGRRLSVWLDRHAPEQAKARAEAYLAEAEPEARAAALEAFSVCPYPLDPGPILADAESAFPALRAAAWDALSRLRAPEVRSFAQAHLDKNKEAALFVLIRNYQPEDLAFWNRYLQGLRIDYASESGWHGIHLALLELFEKKSGVEQPPKALLPLLYESTLCSCCRQRIVQHMRSRRMISAGIWEALQHDSSDEIRAIAEDHFRRIKAGG